MDSNVIHFIFKPRIPFKYNGNRISWQHVENLYAEDLGLDSSAIGLRKLPFLTHEHIYLGPRTRMRVNLAAQVNLNILSSNLLALEKVYFQCQVFLVWLWHGINSMVVVEKHNYHCNILYSPSTVCLKKTGYLTLEANYTT